MMRQPAVCGGAWSMRRSRHQRKAVRVLPVPVGARIRVLSPLAMTGQPWRCGAVGASKTSRNQRAVTGWKLAKGSAGGTGFGVASRRFIPFENNAKGEDLAETVLVELQA